MRIFAVALFLAMFSLAAGAVLFGMWLVGAVIRTGVLAVHPRIDDEE